MREGEIEIEIEREREGDRDRMREREREGDSKQSMVEEYLNPIEPMTIYKCETA